MLEQNGLLLYKNLYFYSTDEKIVRKKSLNSNINMEINFKSNKGIIIYHQKKNQ